MKILRHMPYERCVYDILMVDKEFCLFVGGGGWGGGLSVLVIKGLNSF